MKIYAKLLGFLFNKQQGINEVNFFQPRMKRERVCVSFFHILVGDLCKAHYQSSHYQLVIISR